MAHAFAAFFTSSVWRIIERARSGGRGRGWEQERREWEKERRERDRERARVEKIKWARQQPFDEASLCVREQDQGKMILRRVIASHDQSRISYVVCSRKTLMIFVFSREFLFFPMWRALPQSILVPLLFLNNSSIVMGGNVEHKT